MHLDRVCFLMPADASTPAGEGRSLFCLALCWALAVGTPETWTQRGGSPSLSYTGTLEGGPSLEEMQVCAAVGELGRSWGSGTVWRGRMLEAWAGEGVQGDKMRGGNG